jgi:GT2 family glycosyltransferase
VGTEDDDVSRHDITIVVPYAGPADLLREAVGSVLTQTDPHWRLVVVEEGVQDPAVEPWLRGLCDPRVRYERNPTRLGVAGNFQRCLELAGTDHLVLLGSDDRLRDTYVEVVRRALAEHPGVGVVQPGVQTIDATGETTRPVGDRVKTLLRPRTSGTTLVLGGEDLLASLMRGNWAYFPSLCWDRRRLSRLGFRQDLHTVLDLEVLGRLVLEGGELLLVEDVVFDYRRHRASASALASISTDRFEEERRVMNELSAAAAARGWHRAARAAAWRATSRLHALTLLPAAVVGRRARTAHVLTRHVVGR